MESEKSARKMAAIFLIVAGSLPLFLWIPVDAVRMVAGMFSIAVVFPWSIALLRIQPESEVARVIVYEVCVLLNTGLLYLLRRNY
jgi:hypothetical protein